MVDRLEREMAAQWESMDETRLVADIDPELRDAYIAAWRRQRETFGYYYSPMPWYALDLVEDHDDADLMNIEFLIVDEYQGLNRCNICCLKPSPREESMSSRSAMRINRFTPGEWPPRKASGISNTTSRPVRITSCLNRSDVRERSLMLRSGL